jgi:hypothetical protein
MLFKRLAWAAITSLAMLALTGCNIGSTPAPTLDVSAIYTSAAATLLADFSAQQTQTALAVPPTAIYTNTPQATITSFPTFPPAVGITPPGVGTPAAFPTSAATLSGPLCNNSVFIADVTVPDGTVMQPGQDFEKIWAIQNSGTCQWDEGYSLVFVSGDKMDGYDLPIKTKDNFVVAGATANMKINMTAHLAAGTYSGCWKMQDDKGYFFGTPLCYKIEVKK